MQLAESITAENRSFTFDPDLNNNQQGLQIPVAEKINANLLFGAIASISGKDTRFVV